MNELKHQKEKKKPLLDKKKEIVQTEVHTPRQDVSLNKPVENEVNNLAKDDVLQKLGKPDTISKWSTTERWSYGTSYVEFENGIFTRCYEPHGRDDLKRKLGK